MFSLEASSQTLRVDRKGAPFHMMIIYCKDRRFTNRPIINPTAFNYFVFSDCDRGEKMIGKILYHLLGNAAEDFEAGEESYEDLMEFEEGGWVIVNVSEDVTLSVPLVDPLENLLIEHPSMSVYQRRCETTEGEGLASDEEGDTARSVAVRRHISWLLAAWGIPLTSAVQFLALQRSQSQGERHKMSRSALNRQNLVKTRFSPSEKRYGYFKQPGQRLYNY